MKQFLMICDEKGIEVLKNAFKGECIQFLEVQGMGMGPGNAYNLLVTPILPPINQADAPVENPGQQPVVTETPAEAV